MLKFSAILVAILSFAILSLVEVSAQVILNPGSTNFNVNLLNFTYTSLVPSFNVIGLGTQNYLNVFWDVLQPGASSLSIGVNCTFYGTSAQDCNPKPFIQGLGVGSCTVQKPNYDFANLNKISCAVYNTQNVGGNATYNISFNPLAVSASAALGSLTVGQQAVLTVNIQNTGLLADNYTVNITSPSSYIYIAKPLTATGVLQGNPINKTATVSSGITALASLNQQTQINIAVNSTINSQIGKQITIVIQAGLASLPDFTIFGIIQIMILAALILFLRKSI